MTNHKMNRAPRAWRRIAGATMATVMAVPVVAYPSPVAAAPDATAGDDEDVTSTRDAATDAFAAGEYDAAIEGFQAAHASSGEPTDLFNLGRIHEEIGDLPRALAYYEQFAEQPHLRLEERRLAVERIEVLRVVVEQGQPSQPPPPPTASPTATAQDAPPPTQRPMVISGSVLIAVGVGIAAAGGVTFGLRGRRAREDVDGLAGGDNPQRLTLADAEDLDARGRNADVLQATFIAGGGAVALVGATLLTLGLVRRSKDARASVQASLSPQQSVVSTTWRF